jgi:hypothetical protein
MTSEQGHWVTDERDAIIMTIVTCTDGNISEALAKRYGWNAAFKETLKEYAIAYGKLVSKKYREHSSIIETLKPKIPPEVIAIGGAATPRGRTKYVEQYTKREESKKAQAENKAKNKAKARAKFDKNNKPKIPDMPTIPKKAKTNVAKRQEAAKNILKGKPMPTLPGK